MFRSHAGARIVGAMVMCALVGAANAAHADDPEASPGWQIAGVLGLGPGTDSGLYLSGRVTDQTWIEVGATGWFLHVDPLAGSSGQFELASALVPLWLRIELGDGALRPTIRIGTGIGGTFERSDSASAIIFTMARLTVGATYDLDARMSLFLDAGPSFFVDLASIGSPSAAQAWAIGFGARLGVAFSIA